MPPSSLTPVWWPRTLCPPGPGRPPSARTPSGSCSPNRFRPRWSVTPERPLPRPAGCCPCWFRPSSCPGLSEHESPGWPECEFHLGECRGASPMLNRLPGAMFLLGQNAPIVKRALTAIVFFLQHIPRYGSARVSLCSIRHRRWPASCIISPQVVAVSVGYVHFFHVGDQTDFVGVHVIRREQLDRHLPQIFTQIDGGQVLGPVQLLMEQRHHLHAAAALLQDLQHCRIQRRWWVMGGVASAFSIRAQCPEVAQ